MVFLDPVIRRGDKSKGGDRSEDGDKSKGGDGSKDGDKIFQKIFGGSSEFGGGRRLFCCTQIFWICRSLSNFFVTLFFSTLSPRRMTGSGYGFFRPRHSTG
jgi:hypothetical protein